MKGLAPLACKTDQIDARVLAELARRELVPAIWLPVRAKRERARFFSREYVEQEFANLEQDLPWYRQ